MLIISAIFRSIFLLITLGIPILLCIAFFTLAERKILASIQRRLGPNVVGIYGLLQPFADGLKLLNKQFILPKGSNKFLFIIAPIFFLSLALISWAFIPFGYYEIFINLDLSILYILSISSLSVYGIIIGGWSSNSRYSYLGALRSSAQMISYEISFSIIFISICLCSGSLNIMDIIRFQIYDYYHEVSVLTPEEEWIYQVEKFSNLSPEQIMSYEQDISENPCIAGNECIKPKNYYKVDDFNINFDEDHPLLNKLLEFEIYDNNIKLAPYFLEIDPLYNILDDSYNIWYFIPLWPLLLISIISLLAETNRAPFDLPEAEAELVAGYNVEYSSMAFSLYFLGEYSNMLLSSYLLVCLFFGGFESFFQFFYFIDHFTLFPFFDNYNTTILPWFYLIEYFPYNYIFHIFDYILIIIKTDYLAIFSFLPIIEKFPIYLSYIIKILFFSFLFIWIRSTLPRYRYDQLMEIGWKYFLPFSLSYLIFLIGFFYYFNHYYFYFPERFHGIKKAFCYYKFTNIDYLIIKQKFNWKLYYYGNNAK